jgi:hypothetical protein
VWAETFDQHAFRGNLIIAPLALAVVVIAFAISTGAIARGWRRQPAPATHLLHRRKNMAGTHGQPAQCSLTLGW